MYSKSGLPSLMLSYPDISADDRVGRLTVCVSLFHLLIRLDPKNDFDSEAQTETKLGTALAQVHKVCGPTLLLIRAPYLPLQPATRASSFLSVRNHEVAKGSLMARRNHIHRVCIARWRFACVDL